MNRDKPLSRDYGAGEWGSLSGPTSYGCSTSKSPPPPTPTEPLDGDAHLGSHQLLLAGRGSPTDRPPRAHDLRVLQPMEIYVDDDTAHPARPAAGHPTVRASRLPTSYVMGDEPVLPRPPGHSTTSNCRKPRNRKLNDLLDALDFNQVVIFVSKVARANELDRLLQE